MGVIGSPKRWHRLAKNGRPACGKVGQVTRRETFALTTPTHEGILVCNTCRRVTA